MFKKVVTSVGLFVVILTTTAMANASQPRCENGFDITVSNVVRPSVHRGTMVIVTTDIDQLTLENVEALAGQVTIGHVAGTVIEGIEVVPGPDGRHSINIETDVETECTPAPEPEPESEDPPQEDPPVVHQRHMPTRAEDYFCIGDVAGFENRDFYVYVPNGNSPELVSWGNTEAKAEISISGRGEGLAGNWFTLVWDSPWETGREWDLQFYTGENQVCEVQETEVQVSETDAKSGPCPDCPPAECLLQPGNYVRAHQGTIIGLSIDEDPMIFTSEDQAIEVGLTFAGYECGICSQYLINLDEGTTFVAEGATAYDIAVALNIAEGSPAPNYLNRHMKAAQRALQNWHQGGKIAGWYSFNNSL